MAQESWNRDADATECQQPEGPVLCSNNCGFFGSAATLNLCSKCYGETVLNQGGNSYSTMLQGEKAMITALGDKSLVTVLQGDSAAPAAPILPSTSAELLRIAVPSVSGLTACTSSRQIKGDLAPAASGACVSQPNEQADRRTVNRCVACRKRMGLLGFKCRCGNVLCSLHRYSDKHNCSFDYKAAGRDAIAKANPIVKADKVGKI